MSDHLPECYLSGPPSMCPMCEALRACEQRLTEGWCKAVCANTNYEAGLDAAREAVAGLPVIKPWWDAGDYVHGINDAINAIDALKTK